MGKGLDRPESGVEPCLEIMPVSERGAVRGREAAGRRLREESRREGSPIDKEDMVHICNGILLSHKEE